MKKNLLLIFIATCGLISCMQDRKSTIDTIDTETINSIRNYKYADPSGNLLTIYNSGPKGGIKYTDPNGKEYSYVGFWTQITNETAEPVEFKINFPLDSFEFPSSSGRYMKLLIPADTMTSSEASLPDFGLDVKSFLDRHRLEASSLKRIIKPKDSTAFHVIIISKWNPIARGSGAIRTGFSLKGQNLIYKISAYQMTPNLPLIDKKEISSGSVNLKSLALQE